MSRPASDTHELTEHTDFENGTWTETGHDLQSLPRADGGKQAWLFLTGCFMLEAFVWGFPFSYGVFQVYYSTHEPFASEAGGIAAIGTTQTGIMYFSCPVVAVLIQRWPRLRRPGMCMGAAILTLSLIAASFCNSVSGLLATQGVMYALGGLILYFPILQFIDEWFVAKKGMAYGIMWAGTGSAGVVVPFLLQWLLNTYGFRTALRTWAVILAISFPPCLYFVKGRLPITSSNALRPNNIRFLKQPSFWLFQFGNIVQSLGFFLPALWLPSFAMKLGLPAFAGPLGLALLNLTTCFGAILIGLLVDRFHISIAIAVSSLGQMIAIFVFWGFTSSQPMLYTFALLWGLFGGSFSATWSGYAPAMKKKNPTGQFDTGLILALMAAGRGVGAVISGPLSESLLGVGWEGRASFAYGTGYGLIIIFSGLCCMFGGTACIGRLLRMI